MCTDTTLKKHLNNFKAIKEEIKRLESLAKKESDWIYKENENRPESEKLDWLFVSYDREKIDEKRLKEERPEIFNQYKYFNHISYINTKRI